MPSRERHTRQALVNEQLGVGRLLLDEADDRPWIVTLMFYAALHWVDAYLATLLPPRGVHPPDHEARAAWIARTRALRPIELHYRHLQDRSRDARYDLRAFSKSEVQDLRSMRLDPIRASIEAQLP
jgi:hypothetical protein